VCQIEKWRKWEEEAGGGQAAARNAAPDAKLEGSVVFGDVCDDSARTGTNVSIVDGDDVRSWFNGFAGTRRGRTCGGRGDRWDDEVERGGLGACLRKKRLQVRGKRHED
jgi:hypothetical protein